MTADAGRLGEALDAVLGGRSLHDRPGFAAAVSQGGAVLHRLSRGLASVEAGSPNRPEGRSRIGSTTKQFTCALVLMLEREGRLRRGDPVRRTVPELPPSADGVTLHHLMASTSGLRDPLDLHLLTSGLAFMPPEDLLFLAGRQRGPNAAPGERFLYANIGFHLLGLAVERATGETLERAFQRRLLQPAGMTDSLLHRSDLDLLPGLAAAHLVRPDGGFGRGLFPAPIAGEGGLVSTADDLLRWSAFLRGLEGGALWRDMSTPQPLNNGHTGDYGYGLIRDSYRGAVRIHHPGGVLGASAQLLHLPEHELDVAVLSNSSDLPAPELADRIVDLLLQERLAAPARRLRTEDASPGIVGDWWCAELGSLHAIRADEEGLYADQVLQRLPLHDGGGRTAVFGKPGTATVTVGLDGTEPSNGLNFTQDGATRTFVRLRAGRGCDLGAAVFRSDEADAEALLDGEAPAPLVIRGRRGRSEYDLQPLGDGVWLARPRGGAPVWALLAFDGPEETAGAFALSTPRTRGVRFARAV